jgi:hypothetical protein
MHKAGRSALLAAMDESTQWGAAEHILARISDALEVSNYLFLKANSKAATIPLPDPLPRPGGPAPVEDADPRPDFATGTEVADFFTRMSNL